jgi:hypothetical protein
MPSPEVLIAALIVAAAGLGALCWALWLRVVSLTTRLEEQLREGHQTLDAEVRRAAEEERERAKQQLADTEQRHLQALEDQKKSALTVVVHPFVNTEGQKGIFTRETKVEIGYKYQLFVQGLPCFEPHTMVLESTTHKEVDERMIELLKQKAEQAAESAVLVSSGGAAKTAITIAKTALKILR